MDEVAPILAEVTPVPTPTDDDTPDYTFSTDEAGTITYGGSCSSSTTNATTGNNTITFNTLADGTYNDCTITVTDSANNVSDTLNVTEFEVDTTIPDTTPPVRSDGSPTGSLASGTTQTDISLTTDENATCKYDTSAGVVYDSMANTFTTTGATAHAQVVTGLTDGSSYNYYIRCQDGVPNQNTDDYEISFSVSIAGNNPPTDITLSNNTIDENQAVDTVIGALTTTDADAGDTHTYSLACTTPGANDGSFNISGSDLRSSESFDYETTNSYAICVRTNDGTDNFDKDFTVTVNDVNEAITCTSFTYSNWGECQSNNKQTRTVTSSSPAGCSGGNPIISQACTYDEDDDEEDEEDAEIIDKIIESISSPHARITGSLKKKLSTKKTVHVKNKNFSFKGKDILLAGGTVKIYRGSKLKDKDTVDNNGKWELKIKGKEGKTYTYKVKYYDKNGDKLKSKKYKIKIDAEDPEFTDVSDKTVFRGETVHWKAKDNQKIKRFKVYFNGNIHKIQPANHNKKEEVSSSFVIPLDTPSGIYNMKLRAYDKARNKTTVYMEVRVK